MLSFAFLEVSGSSKQFANGAIFLANGARFVTDSVDGRQNISVSMEGQGIALTSLLKHGDDHISGLVGDNVSVLWSAQTSFKVVEDGVVDFAVDVTSGGLANLCGDSGLG